MRDAKNEEEPLSVIDEKEGEDEVLNPGNQENNLIETSYLLLDPNNSKILNLEAELSDSANEGGMVFNNKTIITDNDLNNFELIQKAHEIAKKNTLPKKESRGAQVKEIEMINRIDDLIAKKTDDHLE